MNQKLLMSRCLLLAKKGKGKTSPNPMVGCVIVYNNTIIGEGYHKGFGCSHAEVEAIKNVKDKKLLKKSTLYVNLEPCNHHGKTPPCTDLIIDEKIPNVVIGSIDPNSKVSGKGIEKLKKNKINITLGVLKKECMELNKRFFCYHLKKRPYIILKWAESADGYISPHNQTKGSIFWITSKQTNIISHKWRSEEDTIAVGINTINNDDPELTNRFWTGKSPYPVVIDPKNKLNLNSKLLKRHKKIYHFIDKKIVESNHRSIKIDFNNSIKELLFNLYKDNISSILIEGGRITIQKFIDSNFWDEARLLVGEKKIENGIKSPSIRGVSWIEKKINVDKLYISRNHLSNNL